MEMPCSISPPPSPNSPHHHIPQRLQHILQLTHPHAAPQQQLRSPLRLLQPKRRRIRKRHHRTRCIRCTPRSPRKRLQPPRHPPYILPALNHIPKLPPRSDQQFTPACAPITYVLTLIIPAFSHLHAFLPYY